MNTYLIKEQCEVVVTSFFSMFYLCSLPFHIFSCFFYLFLLSFSQCLIKFQWFGMVGGQFAGVDGEQELYCREQFSSSLSLSFSNTLCLSFSDPFCHFLLSLESFFDTPLDEFSFFSAFLYLLRNPFLLYCQFSQ